MQFKVSLKGGLYSAAAVLLLTIGMVRQELIAEICGAVLTAYSVFAVVSSGITAFFWRNTAVEVSLKKNILTVSPHTGTKRFPPAVLGSSASFIVQLSGEPVAKPDGFCKTKTGGAASKKNISVPLKKYTASFTALLSQRRRYFYVCRMIVISDFAGFFSFKIRQPDFAPLLRLMPFFMTAPPVSVAGLTIPKLLSASTGSETSLQRSSELYESRNYFPGDDPRKIHWKLYAHTRSLAVRLGEYEPPPVKTVSVYIEEPSAANKTEYGILEPFFDTFTGRVNFLIMRLLQAGLSCTVLLCRSFLPAAETAEEGRADNRSYPVLYSYTVSGSGAYKAVQELLTVPRVRLGGNRSRLRGRQNGYAPVSLADVYKAVPKNSALFYCYLPGIRQLSAAEKHTNSVDVLKKKAAAHAALQERGIQTFFSIDSGAGTAAAFAGSAAAAGATNPAAMNVARTMHTDSTAYTAAAPAYHDTLQTLLYRTRKERRTARYAKLISQAAERDRSIFTQGYCNAQIL